MYHSEEEKHYRVHFFSDQSLDNDLLANCLFLKMTGLYCSCKSINDVFQRRRIL